MSKLGSNFAALRNMEMNRRINWMIKLRRLIQCGIPIHCYEICFHFCIYSVLNWSCYCKTYVPLFTIIMNNLILYQKFLNERRRTIYIFIVACALWFCSIALYLVSNSQFENFVIHFHLQIIFDMIEYFIIGWLFQCQLLLINSKIIFRSVRTSAITEARSLSIA